MGAWYWKCICGNRRSATRKQCSCDRLRPPFPHIVEDQEKEYAAEERGLCLCGADKVKDCSGRHSDWCPKYVKEGG